MILERQETCPQLDHEQDMTGLLVWSLPTSNEQFDTFVKAHFPHKGHPPRMMKFPGAALGPEFPSTLKNFEDLSFGTSTAEDSTLSDVIEA